MAGIPTEASILEMVERAMPGKLLNVFAHSAGGGKLLAIMQFKKSAPTDEGRQRQAALLAFSAFPELKHVILVDEDVDIFDSDDVMWAMQTRYQGMWILSLFQAYVVIRSTRPRRQVTARQLPRTVCHAKRFSTVPCRSI